MFNRFWSWLAYLGFTVSRVAHGNSRIDDLRQEVKRVASLLVSNLSATDVRARMKSYEKGGHVVYLDQYGMAWLLVPEKLDVSMQCTLNGKILFASGWKEEIPMRNVVSVHRSLTKAMQLMLRQYGGLAGELERVIQASKYKG